MEKYEEVLKELFGRDYLFALSTSHDNIPSVRYVDMYYDGKSFYVVTYSGSQKVQDIMKNPNVAFCDRNMYSFAGQATNIGHPLAESNKEIRDVLIKEFAAWYFLHNDENHKTMCYVKIDPTFGFFHKDGIGYRVDFVKKEVETFPFVFDIVA